MLIATSYESKETILKTYKESQSILNELQAMKGAVQVYHDVDARKLTQCSVLLPYLATFDLIIWNFPCMRDPVG